MIDKLLSMLLVVVIGLALVPVVVDSITDHGLDGAAGTMVDLMPLFFVLAIVFGIVKFIRNGNGGD